ncbi:MAG: Helicase associated domain protein [Candidatus Scalindua sp.]
MLPKHHKTRFYLNAGLFDNLSSFTELEKRISGLPTPVEEGDAFEVFAEAYFFTQKIEQAEEVWPLKSIPFGTKENLSLGANQKDMGVDGVYKTTSGEFNAYQAKFRSDRKSLTWGEISTFMGLTDKVNQRVLFTNSNDITSVINERSGFHCIRGNDLDRLGKNDFNNILKWLKSGVLEVERKRPQPQCTEGVKIVFSTYQSADIVAEGMDNSYRFDLGIFDEAHKTAGRKGKKFGFALKYDNLRIKKCLFLTATPRHYNINKKNEDGDFDLVYSMDNPDVYGMVAHQLSFAVAIRQNIICNYKVIISVVTSDQVNKEMLKRGEVLINGNMVNAQHIANQIAFKEAISKYGIRRIFTFHRSVNTARSFTVKGSEGIQTQLPEFNAFHINGTMTTAVREGIMNEFKNSDLSVISNARCLTEGVDLPAVDMVAFMSPKKSKIDIIQATGRAMRKDPHNPAKALGYILVPLYLEITTSESIEEAVAKADFGEVWNVLQALQEHDEVLADIIRQLQENKGRGKRQEGDDFGDIIDIHGVDISLKTLRESITAICVDKLGFTWDLRYGELIKYKEQYGDCNVPSNWIKNEQLANWVITQRSNYRHGKLNENRIKRLDDIGFIWKFGLSEEEQKEIWKVMINALKEYKENHGDCNVPRWFQDNLELGRWVYKQRENYQLKTLSDNHIKCLKDIGFVWDTYKLYWEERFKALKRYKEKNGDCNVPFDWVEDNIQLGQWVNVQRGNYRSQKLNAEQIKHLEDIGFTWDITWENMLNTLKKYKKNHGDCNVPYDWIEDDKPLGQWVRAQRRNYQNRKLSDVKAKHLKEIGLFSIRG